MSEYYFGGIQKCTTIDYPGELACVLFTKGCCCRCPYCHNKELADGSAAGLYPLTAVAKFIETRRRKLTAVVLSGGEPALMPPHVISSIRTAARSAGMKLKMDTCGMLYLPENIIYMLDAVAVDIKTTERNYGAYLKDGGSATDDLHHNIRRLMEYKNDRPDFLVEYRTTVHKALHTFEDLKQMKEEFLDRYSISADMWYLQQFHTADMFDNSLNDKETYSDQELLDMAAELGCKVRGIKETEKETE